MTLDPAGQQEWNLRVQLVSMLERAPEWRFAKTMPDNPHWYSLKKTWRDKKAFMWAVQNIRNVSKKEYFERRPYQVWYANGYKYWSMGWPVDQTTLINRCVSPYEASYDRVAEGYDALYDSLIGESREAFRMADIQKHHKVLDVGCGTGLASDVGLVCAEYTGFDPSRRMLEIFESKLKRRGPIGVRQRIFPAELGDVYFQPIFDRILLMFGVANHVPPEHLARLKDMLAPGGMAFIMWLAPGYEPKCDTADMPIHASPDVNLTPPGMLRPWEGKYLLQCITREG